MKETEFETYTSYFTPGSHYNTLTPVTIYKIPSYKTLLHLRLPIHGGFKRTGHLPTFHGFPTLLSTINSLFIQHTVQSDNLNSDIFPIARHLKWLYTLDCSRSSNHLISINIYFQVRRFTHVAKHHHQPSQTFFFFLIQNEIVIANQDTLHSLPFFISLTSFHTTLTSNAFII